MTGKSRGGAATGASSNGQGPGLLNREWQFESARARQIELKLTTLKERRKRRWPTRHYLQACGTR